MPLFVLAGPPTNLTANNIVHDWVTGNIEASGDVIIIQGNLTLKTHKVIYNAALDSIIVIGSIEIYDAIKNEVTYATYGELSADLKDGLLDSARIIQKKKLQITAAKIKREGGRYMIMNKAVSSYCKICKSICVIITNRMFIFQSCMSFNMLEFYISIFFAKPICCLDNF